MGGALFVLRGDDVDAAEYLASLGEVAFNTSQAFFGSHGSWIFSLAKAGGKNQDLYWLARVLGDFHDPRAVGLLIAALPEVSNYWGEMPATTAISQLVLCIS